MKTEEKTTLAAKMEAATRLLLMVPQAHSTFQSIEVYGDDVTVTFQAWTQAAVAACRAALPRAVWNKHSDPHWTYLTEIDGIKVKMYGCSEAPASCRQVEEEYTVKEQVPIRFENQLQPVPVEFEEREVVKVRKVWKCDDPNFSDDVPAVEPWGAPL